MVPKHSQQRKLEPSIGDSLNISDEFLPDLSSAPMFLGVILICELLAICLCLAAYGLEHLGWQQLGMVSMAIQWIALASLLILASLRPWLKRQSAAVAGVSCFIVVQLVTLSFGATLLYFYGAILGLKLWNLAEQMTISMIFSGIGLRFMYLQQQFRNQQQAQLNAQLQALQSRIQPHFLFNCMNSIACLIEIDPAKAETAVEDLSELFRASLAEPGLVPIRDELSLCDRYLAMEKLRMGERLQLQWDIDEAMKHQLIPSLTLQPLLENAIKHGIHPLAEGGIIRVAVLKRNDQLYLEVSNPVAPGPKVAGNQVALNNVLARLQAHFGDGVRWDINEHDSQYQIIIQYGLKNLATTADN